MKTQAEREAEYTATWRNPEADGLGYGAHEEYDEWGGPEREALSEDDVLLGTRVSPSATSTRLCMWP